MIKKIERQIASFIAACDAQMIAWRAGDARMANKQGKIMLRAFDTLRDVGTDGREALLALVDHPHANVALNAANFSLKYASVRSLEALSRLAEGESFVAERSKQAMKNWETGAWQLE